jgi:HlyD family secretion protein
MVILLMIGAGFAGSAAIRSRKGPASDQATFAVTKGPLTISVIASGTLKAREQIILKNEVEGRTSIIFLIPEGTYVKAGELLVELDASRLLDERVDQEIRVKNAEAAFVSARENMAVVENQAQADVEKAQLVYQFAKDDLKKYQEGEYPNLLKESESKITLAREELTRAKDKSGWSKRLFDEKYISEIELAADELTMKRRDLELELAKNNLDLFTTFTHERKQAQLDSDMKQAAMALERTVRRAKADVVQARAVLEAKEAEYGRQKDKLKKIEGLIQKAKIYAPADGQVIHATSAQGGGPGRRTAQPLDEGQEVRERQELIHLPTTSAAKVEVAIQEASLDKVRIGLPVKVTVDALPGETFWGSVAKIAPLPDAQSAWLNPDLKVYNMDIHLEKGSSALRTGMSCKAEIIVEQHKEATYIPVQAVLRVGGEPTVYLVKEEGKLEPRKVEIGLDNNRMVRIVKGLVPGEVVSLTPPLEAASVDHAEIAHEMAKGPAPTRSGEEAPGGRETLEEPAAGEKNQPARAKRGAMGPEAPPAGRPELRDAGKNTARVGQPREAGSQTQPPEGQEKRKTPEGLSPQERERIQAMSPDERKRFREERMGSVKQREKKNE